MVGKVPAGLLVSIGGGAPSRQPDIRLGDVVVANQTKTWGRGSILLRQNCPRGRDFLAIKQSTPFPQKPGCLVFELIPDFCIKLSRRLP